MAKEELMTLQEMYIEKWIEFGKNNMYRISNHGRIQTRFDRLEGGKVVLSDVWKDKKFKKSKTDKRGGFYLRVNLHGEQKRVHLLVWEFFKGPRTKGLVIDHEDGDRLNNSIWNLMEKTQKANIQNLIDRGNFPYKKKKVLA